MPTHLVLLARTADIIETAHDLRRTVFDLATAATADGVNAAIADGIFDMLCGRCVKLSTLGHPCPRTVDDSVLADPGLLRPAAPCQHILSNLLRASAKAGSGLLMCGATSRDSTRLLSAGGFNAGKSLVAPAGLQAARFNDEHFTEILRWRLGVADGSTSAICQNLAASTDNQCKALDPSGSRSLLLLWPMSN